MSSKSNDLSVLGKVISLIWPLGLILYFVKKKKERRAANQALNMALIGFGISLVVSIIYSII